MTHEGGLVLESERSLDEESKWIINEICRAIYGLSNLKEDLIERLSYRLFTEANSFINTLIKPNDLHLTYLRD